MYVCVLTCAYLLQGLKCACLRPHLCNCELSSENENENENENKNGNENALYTLLFFTSSYPFITSPYHHPPSSSPSLIPIITLLLTPPPHPSSSSSSSPSHLDHFHTCGCFHEFILQAIQRQRRQVLLAIVLVCTLAWC